jgi:mono/diheme cytochrome c family protein
MRLPAILMIGLLLAAACADPAERAAEAEAMRQAAAADTVRLAAEAYDAAGFDAIEWEADSVALSRGSVVWAISCSKCHGPTGVGDGGFVMRGDTLRPPSFQADDWRFASDLDGLRRYVFAGNAEGMPHWGIAGLKPTDIDAVSRYIREKLRTPLESIEH